MFLSQFSFEIDSQNCFCTFRNFAKYSILPKTRLISTATCSSGFTSSKISAFSPQSLLWYFQKSSLKQNISKILVRNQYRRFFCEILGSFVKSCILVNFFTMPKKCRKLPEEVLLSILTYKIFSSSMYLHILTIFPASPKWNVTNLLL